MKVRLYPFAAVAAIALAGQGLAQQNEDSLERALADLNAGLAAPSLTAGLTVSGDARARNRWYDDGTDDTNYRDIDVRTRLNFHFQITEASEAFVGFSGREAFGGSEAGRWDMFSGEGLERAWFAVDSLVGDGGHVKIGRDYYTLGQGRVLGSEEWDNLVSSFSGIWYEHPAAGFNAHAAMLNGVENGFSESDDMIYILGFEYTFDQMQEVGEIHFEPYWMRDETASNTGVTPDATHETWLGVAVTGEVMGVGYEVDYSTYDHADLSGDAFYVEVAVQLDALESLPGIESGQVDVAFSSADEEFFVAGINAIGAPYSTHYHNAAGFADLLGTSGIWTSDTDTLQVGIGVSPAENWEGRIAYINIESGPVDVDEIDLSVGTMFNGNVSAWFGYGFIDSDDISDESVFWAVLELPFGG